MLFRGWIYKETATEPDENRILLKRKNIMLNEYKRKRDFKITPEPSGDAKSAKSNRRADKESLTFVIQKHDATRLHYDFRLEIDGVMVSWAVPKGPSLSTTDRRLAVMTEDHPMEYSSFEGIIPAKQYGAGEVIIWDQGVYSPDDKGDCAWHDKDEANRRMRDGLKKGKLSFYVKGEKIEGSWTLVKIHSSDKEWLLIKHNDKFADSETDITKLDQSVVSGLTLADLQENGSDKIWTRSGEQKADPKTTGRSTKKPKARAASSKSTSTVAGGLKQKINEILSDVKTAKFPKKLEPMDGSHSNKPFPDKGWCFEPKLSGTRILASIESGAVQLRGVDGMNLTDDFPSVCKSLSKYQGDYVFDGVIVENHSGESDRGKSYDSQSVSTKSRSASTKSPKSTRPMLYIVDVLYADGKDVTGLPFLERKELLKLILEPNATVRGVQPLGTDGEAALHACAENGLPGVIGKREDSEYKPGVKSRLWTIYDAVPKQGRVVHIDTAKSKAEVRSPRERTSAGKGRTGANKERTSAGKERTSSIKGASRRKKSSELTEDAHAVLAQLENVREKMTLEIGSFQLPVTSLSKIYWPAYGDQPAITKRDYLKYLAQVSDYIIPHLTDRMLTLVRHPSGITGGRFYQKHWDQRLPEFVDTVNMYTESEQKGKTFLLCNNLPTLLWLGQIADLELHTSHTRLKAEFDAADLSIDMSGSVEALESSVANYPDYIVLDLDPYLYSGKEKKGAEPELHRKGFEKTVEIAFILKASLDDLNLDCFIKTSGKTGLHLYIPIMRNVDYDRVRAISQIICRQVLKGHPREVTMEWATKNRTGKVFLDHNMNARSKSLASIYSLRTAPEACISTPLSWDELPNVYPTDFNIHTVPNRLAEQGDIWSDILEHKADLTKILSSEIMNAKLTKKRRSTQSRYRKRASSE